MKIDVLTLFPEMFTPMDVSMMKAAQDAQIIEFETHNFREYAVNKHGHVDDYPYGGGAGMLLRVEPVVEALESLMPSQNTRIILTDPAGKTFTQAMAHEWSQADHLIFICGHYEGFDERIRSYVTDEVSVGDYVLTNGEIPTLLMIDATVRLMPQVVGNQSSIVEESHQSHLLEYPQYTRPQEYRGMKVPEILLSGHHENVAAWRLKEAIRRTYLNRPDMLEGVNLSSQEQKYYQEIIEEESQKP